MKKTRTILRLFVLTLFISAILIPASYAENGEDVEEKIIFEAKEIKDLGKLYQRALEGISDRNETDSYATLLNQQTKAKKDLKIYKTTQKLKVKKSEDLTVTTYATTAIVPFAIPPYDSYKYHEDWDESGGVKAYSTIYWEEIDSGTKTYMDMVYISGGWSVKDSRLTVRNTKLTYAQQGEALGGGTVMPAVEDKDVDITFDVTPPSSWIPVSKSYGVIGAAQNADVVHSATGDTWKIQNVTSEGSIPF